MYEVAILSFALQICGSLMLLIIFFRKIKKEDLDKAYSSGYWMTATDNPKADLEKNFYDKNPVNIFLWKVVMTRISFFYLLTGFLISVYGNINGYNKNIALFDIVIWTCIFFVFAIFLLILWTELIKKILK